MAEPHSPSILVLAQCIADEPRDLRSFFVSGQKCLNWTLPFSAVENTVIKAKSLWETNGAVIMAVRRPGWFLCREVTQRAVHHTETVAARVCDLTCDDLHQPLRPPQEASELSSLKPQLEELGVPLVAVVKENIGTEIEDFRPHFAGDIYIDEEASGTFFLNPSFASQFILHARIHPKM